MAEEPTRQPDDDPPVPPVPPRVLDYYTPDEDRPWRFRRAMWRGVAGFALTVVALFTVMPVLASIGGDVTVLAVIGLGAIVGGAVVAAIRSYKSSGTLGFVAGYFLAMGITLLVAGVGCFLILASL